MCGCNFPIKLDFANITRDIFYGTVTAFRINFFFANIDIKAS